MANKNSSSASGDSSSKYANKENKEEMAKIARPNPPVNDKQSEIDQTTTTPSAASSSHNAIPPSFTPLSPKKPPPKKSSKELPDNERHEDSANNTCGMCGKRVANKYMHDDLKFEKTCQLCNKLFFTCLKCASKLVHNFEGKTKETITTNSFNKCTSLYYCHKCNESVCYSCGRTHERGT